MWCKECRTSGALFDSQPMVHNPVGVEWPFHRGHQRPLEKHRFMLWFIAVAKLRLWSSNGNNFMVGVTTTWGTVSKGLELGRLRTTALSSQTSMMRLWLWHQASTRLLEIERSGKEGSDYSQRQPLGVGETTGVYPTAVNWPDEHWEVSNLYTVSSTAAQLGPVNIAESWAIKWLTC